MQKELATLRKNQTSKLIHLPQVKKGVKLQIGVLSRVEFR